MSNDLKRAVPAGSSSRISHFWAPKTRNIAPKQDTENKTSAWRSGKIYFSRRSERNFYFLLTMIVILWSALVKFGILSN